MKTDSSAHSFRPATTDDLPRLRRWLHAPEVKRWWGEPREQFERHCYVKQVEGDSAPGVDDLNHCNRWTGVSLAGKY